MKLHKGGWKNKHKTTDRKCKCGSWKQHWIKYSLENWPKVCSVDGCNNKATLGAHIFNSDCGERDEYIIPACDSCNKLDDMFSLKTETILVSANKSKTCES